MARLEFVVVCNAINSVPGERGEMTPNLVAPQIALRPRFVPGNFSFALSVGISGVDLQKENRMRFTITTPEGRLLQDSGETELPKIPIKDTMPAEYQGFVINMDIRNLVIENEGAYSFALYINGECIGTHTIPIFKQVIQ